MQVAKQIPVTMGRSLIEDDLGRSFRKLRLSVTSACNYRCVYCNPENHGVSETPACTGNQTLKASELADYVIKIHKVNPLYSVRITGGEPLLYPHLEELIFRLKEGGLPEVSITTNGHFLSGKLDRLQKAGLDSVNLSLDAAEEDIFRRITGNGDFSCVMESFHKAAASGIRLKMNATVMRGINDSQVSKLFNLCYSQNTEIRFIELMEMGPLKGRVESLLFPASEILQEIQKVTEFHEVERPSGSTSRLYRTGDGFVFGIIANSSHPFCEDCDRLRLDSTGKIYGCLSSEAGEEIGSREMSVAESLRRALSIKKRDRFTGSSLSMKKIGG